jgi:pilus assembly protein CpaB
MSRMRLLILLVAAAAAIVAVFLVRSISAPKTAVASTAPVAEPVAPKPVEVVPAVQVLVAKRELPMGQYLSAEDLEWQAWPEKSPVDSFLVKSKAPDALEKSVGAVVRVAMAVGEPVVPAKIVQPGEQGFMAAVLAPGMRAVSVQISPETAAGGFILPNDRVDVLMTRMVEKDGNKTVYSERMLANIRVLAIDAVYGAPQEGQGQVLVGTRATLELSENDTRLLQTARKAGEVSLSLRSVADLRDKTGSLREDRALDNSNDAAPQIVRIYRYGQQGQPAPVR